MINKQAIAGLLLATSSPVLLWASTLSARVECKIDMQNKQVVPVSYRPESYPFLLLLAAVQGYFSWQLLKKENGQAALAGSPDPLGLAPSQENEFAPEFTPTAETQVSELAMPRPIQVGAHLEQVPVVNPFDTPKGTQFYDVAKDLGGDRAKKQFPQNCLIVGTPGAGKGIVLSNAIRSLKAQFPELYIIGVDPKAQPSEDGLWEVGDHSYTQVLRKPVMGLSADEIAEWVATAIHTFNHIPAGVPRLLVVDELNALKASLDQLTKDSKFKPVQGWLNSYLTHLISLGDGAGKWFWGVAQSANDKALPFDTSVRNNLRTVAIVNMDNIGAVQGLLRTDIIPSNQKSIDAVQKNVDDSPVNRAFYDRKTNEWHPMPKLKNYGKDRNPFANSSDSGAERSAASEPFLRDVNLAEPSLEKEFSEFADKGSEVHERSEPLIEPLDPGIKTDERLESRILELKEAGLTQDQIILSIWGFKKGGSANYQAARSKYQRLTHEG